MDHKGENMISGQNMVSGSLPIESGRAQGCSFSGKMAISGSGSSPIESGHAQGCFFSAFAFAFAVSSQSLCLLVQGDRWPWLTY